MKTQIDSGDVGPSQKTYRVTWPHDHETLKTGDLVRIVLDPSKNTLILRVDDSSLHPVQDKHKQYVHLEEVAS